MNSKVITLADINISARSAIKVGKCDKEKGFYSNILGTSAVFSIFCDSISFDKKNMEFTYYGRQRIERRSNILMRELVTAGQLKRVPRTDNNAHGLHIVNWRTLLNKDIEQKTKSNY